MFVFMCVCIYVFRIQYRNEQRVYGKKTIAIKC